MTTYASKVTKNQDNDMRALWRRGSRRWVQYGYGPLAFLVADAESGEAITEPDAFGACLPPESVDWLEVKHTSDGLPVVHPHRATVSPELALTEYFEGAWDDTTEDDAMSQDDLLDLARGVANELGWKETTNFAGQPAFVRPAA